MTCEHSLGYAALRRSIAAGLVAPGKAVVVNGDPCVVDTLKLSQDSVEMTFARGSTVSEIRADSLGGHMLVRDVAPTVEVCVGNAGLRATGEPA